MDSLQMNNGDPPPPVSGAGGGHQRTANGNISMDSAIAALEQHDTLFHRQVMHLRQQQVGSHHNTQSDHRHYNRTISFLY